MGKSIQVASLLREHNLLQLAYDSAIMAEKRQPIQRVAFGQVLDFSDKIYMFANLDHLFIHDNFVIYMGFHADLYTGSDSSPESLV